MATKKTKKPSGTFVDHVPAKPKTRPIMFKAYEETRELYEKIFGPPDPMWWPKGGGRATCGDSYSGLIPKITTVRISA